MRIKYLLLFLIPSLLFSTSLSIGQKLTLPTTKDQFDQSVKITPSTKLVIIALTRKGGEIVNNHFQSNPDYLQKQNAVFLIKSSGVPNFVLKLFILPEYKKYSYSVGLLENRDFLESLQEKDAKLVYILLQDGVVLKLEYRNDLKK